jgi:hypothetical protein|tara:strand:+ start:1085 stop:1282 length:198 start_codon:yes stop_codon:yes gene_type:complete
MPGGGGGEPNDALRTEELTNDNILSENLQPHVPDVTKNEVGGLEYLGITFVFFGLMYFLYLKFKD